MKKSIIIMLLSFLFMFVGEVFADYGFNFDADECERRARCNPYENQKWIIRPQYPDLIPNDGFMDKGSWSNPYILQRQW